MEQAQDDYHQFCDPRQLHYSDPTVIAKIKEFHNEAQDDHHQFCDPRQLHYSDPTVIAKIKEFHNEVTSLEPSCSFSSTPECQSLLDSLPLVVYRVILILTVRLNRAIAPHVGRHVINKRDF